MPIGSEHREYYPAGEYAANLAKKALLKATQSSEREGEGERELVSA
jgi:hypothetical protein